MAKPVLHIRGSARMRAEGGVYVSPKGWHSSLVDEAYRIPDTRWTVVLKEDKRKRCPDRGLRMRQSLSRFSQSGEGREVGTAASPPEKKLR